MTNFKTFELSVEFYHRVEDLRIARHLKDQLVRAASSVSLNLAEGRGKSSRRDQLRFFDIAMGSLRECGAVFRLCRGVDPTLLDLFDHLGASLYLLIKKAR